MSVRDPHWRPSFLGAAMVLGLALAARVASCSSVPKRQDCADYDAPWKERDRCLREAK